MRYKTVSSSDFSAGHHGNRIVWDGTVSKACSDSVKHPNWRLKCQRARGMERVLANVIFTHSSLSLSAQAPVRPGEPALLNRDESRSVSPQTLQNPAIGTSNASRTCSGSVRNKIRLLYTFASSVPAKVSCMFSISGAFISPLCQKSSSAEPSEKLAWS